MQQEDPDDFVYEPFDVTTVGADAHKQLFSAQAEERMIHVSATQRLEDLISHVSFRHIQKVLCGL